VLGAHDNRLQRTVAIKVLLRHGPETEARFLREARITARLQHPGIVPVYEVGVHADGEPYYAMKLIAGRPLRDLIAEADTFAARLGLLPCVLAVADAIAYAHSQGIVHRDLKPANIIVGDFAETIVIDWGLAKELRAARPALDASAMTPSPAADDPARTMEGSIVGTPAYMAPEQARGESVDERADVYALGAVLYHVLTGRMPFAENCKTVLLALVRTRSPAGIEHLVPEISPELATIVDKAMQWDRGARYATASEFAADLRAFLTGQLVAAHAYSPRQLFLRVLRRHRSLIAISAAALAVIAIIGVASLARILHERDVATSARHAAEAAHLRASSRTAELILAQAERALDTDPTAAIAWLKQYPVDGPNTPYAGAIAADSQSRGVARHVLRGHKGRVTSTFFDSKTSTIYSASTDGTVRAWDVGSGAGTLVATGLDYEESIFSEDAQGLVAAFLRNDHAIEVLHLRSRTRTTLAGHTGKIHAFRFSSGAAVLASASQDGTIRLWSLEGKPPRVLRGHRGDVHSVALAPHGATVVSAGLDGTLRRWDLASGAHEILSSAPAATLDVAFSPDGTALATSHAEGSVLLWRVHAGRARSPVPLRGPTPEPAIEVSRALADGPPLAAVRFSADGKRLAHLAPSQHLYVWDLASRTLVLERQLQGTCWWFDFSPDSSFLALGFGTGLVRLLDLARPAHHDLLGHGAAVVGTFSKDARWLVTSGAYTTLRLWPVPTSAGAYHSAHSDAVLDVDAAPRGHRAVSVGIDGRVALWDLDTASVTPLGAHGAAAWNVAFSPEGGRVATASWDGTVGIWPVNGDRPVRLAGHRGVVQAVTWLSPGDQVVSGGADGTVRLWDISRRTSRILHHHDALVLRVAASPDGRHVASASKGGVVSMYDRRTSGANLFIGHVGGIDALAFFPAGQMFATGGRDRSLRGWSLHDGERWRVADQRSFVFALSISPDGETVAAGTRDGTIIVRHATDGSERRLLGHSGWIRDLTFTPDGRYLVSGGHDLTIRIWDLARHHSIVFRGHEREITGVDVTSDGRWAVSASFDKTVRAWPIDLAHAPPAAGPELRRWLDSATSATTDTVEDL
jgi:WD40 repeat protein